MHWCFQFHITSRELPLGDLSMVGEVMRFQAYFMMMDLHIAQWVEVDLWDLQAQGAVQVINWCSRRWFHAKVRSLQQVLRAIDVLQTSIFSTSSSCWCVIRMMQIYVCYISKVCKHSVVGARLLVQLVQGATG